MLTRKQYEYLKRLEDKAKHRKEERTARRQAIEEELASVDAEIADAEDAVNVFKGEIKQLMDDYERVNNR